MRATYPQPDGRGIIARKWSVLKINGPLVLVCEKVLKKLIQHGWPASYSLVKTNRLYPTVAIWSNDLGETPEFLLALERAIFIVARSFRVTVSLDFLSLSLVGEWVVKIRLVNSKPAAATIHPAPDCPF